MRTIQVTFRHPTDSVAVRTAGLQPEVTPAFCIEKLLEDGFMPPAPSGAPYGLVTETGILLDPNSPLHAGGINEDTTLSVTPAHQGAEPVEDDVRPSAEDPLV